MFSILYQRGIYPPETFVQVSKYGLSILVTKDDALKTYINNVLNQTKGSHNRSFFSHISSFLPYNCHSEWLETGTVQKLVVVITSNETNETVERWVFDIITDMPSEGR